MEKIDKDPRFYNFIIVGAGPAGLTSAIVAARNGLKAVIIEKGEVAGPKPRGEGMRHYPLIDEILGDQFLQSICHFKTVEGSVFHSPGDIKQVKLKRTNPGYFFEWRKFIDRFVEITNDLKVEFILNSEVIEPIVKNDMCIGVKYKTEDGKIHDLYGNSILDCSGHVGVIGKEYGISYENDINCPTVKCLVSNGNIDIDKTAGLHFYLIGNGDLDYSPNFPQCVAYMFPIGGKDLEIGLMLRMKHAREMKTVRIPSDQEIMEIWRQVKESYPGFSDFLKGSKIEYEELTAISNSNMVENYIPVPGVVLIGDSAGFVDPFGSSGLYFSMAMANFFVNRLSKTIKEFGKEKIPVSEYHKKLWNPDNIETYKKQFEEFEVYKQIKNSYNLIGAFEYKIFKRLRTSEKINNKWDYLSSLLQQAEH